MTLASLPDSLDETYERMLRLINNNCVEDAKRILTLICFAKRPMTTKEVIDGTAVELGESPAFNPSRRLLNEQGIRQICPSLIEIYEGTLYMADLTHKPDMADLTYKPEVVSRVRFVHHSVQEYLRSNHKRQTNPDFQMSPAESHRTIAETCLVYLQYSGLSSEISSGAQRDVGRWSGPAGGVTLYRFPLANYAARYWYEHYKDAEQSINPATPVARYAREVLEGRAFQDWIYIYDPDWFDRLPSVTAAPLYYASLLGLPLLLLELLSKEDIDINALGGHYGSALQAAAAEGHESVVKILLSKDAKSDTQNGRYGNALQAASAKGHESIVRLLLASNLAEIDPLEDTDRGALQAASDHDQNATFTLLLSNILDMEPKDGFHRAALQTIADQDQEQTIALLLSKNADDDAQDGLYRSILRRSSLVRPGDVSEPQLSQAAQEIVVR